MSPAEQARAAGDRAQADYLRDHPHDYRGAARHAVEVQAAALAALHGARGARWGSWEGARHAAP